MFSLLFGYSVENDVLDRQKEEPTNNKIKVNDIYSLVFIKCCFKVKVTQIQGKKLLFYCRTFFSIFFKIVRVVINQSE